MILDQIKANINAVIYVTLFGLGFAIGWTLKGYLAAIKFERYEAQVIKEKEAQGRAVIAAQTSYLEESYKRTEDNRLAEVEHEADQKVVYDLSIELSKRVPIHIPIARSCTLSTDNQTDSNSNESSGLLSERVDTAFAEFTVGVEQLAKSCDQLNIDAIRMNAQSR